MPPHLDRRRSPEAYGELVRRHQIAVYNVAFRLVGERQAALDVPQDAFVRAYRSLQTFKKDLPFGPRIKRIARSWSCVTFRISRTTTSPRPDWAN